MSVAVELASSDLLRTEVARFLEAARQRSEFDVDPRRRTQRRYHRSWPLRVWCDDRDHSAALHNASELGVAFLSAVTFPADACLFLKLFCHAEPALWVPAFVRHATPTPHGYLVGAEFALDNGGLCEQAVQLSSASDQGACPSRLAVSG